MSDRNWEAELAKIDKQLASVSDEQLMAERPAPPAGKGGVARSPTDARMATQGQTTRSPVSAAPSAAAGGTWRSWLKVSIAVAAAAGLMFWPWPARCGLPLMGFTAATGGVAVLGLWSAVATWRHRLGLAHVASILVTAWGLALGAREVLPRVGYAIPTIERPGQWSCEGLPALPTPPASTTPGPGTTSPDATPPASAPGTPPAGGTGTPA